MFVGRTALSVEMRTKVSTFDSIADSTQTLVPKILLLMYKTIF